MPNSILHITLCMWNKRQRKRYFSRRKRERIFSQKTPTLSPFSFLFFLLAGSDLRQVFLFLLSLYYLEADGSTPQVGFSHSDPYYDETEENENPEWADGETQKGKTEVGISLDSMYLYECSLGREWAMSHRRTENFVISKTNNRGKST